MDASLVKYFNQKMKTASFGIVPGHHPDFKTKEEIDTWVEKMEKMMEMTRQILAEEDKTICPRCKNEEIKETDNYCIICGMKIIKEKENENGKQ